MGGYERLRVRDVQDSTTQQRSTTNIDESSYLPYRTTSISFAVTLLAYSMSVVVLIGRARTVPGSHERCGGWLPVTDGRTVSCCVTARPFLKACVSVVCVSRDGVLGSTQDGAGSMRDMV